MSTRPAAALLGAVLAASFLLGCGGSGSTSGTSDRATGGTTPTGPEAQRSHPQLVEPVAGQERSQGGSYVAVTPLDRASSRPRSLAEVKRELKLLDLCGGFTDPAFSAPLVKSSGPGFTADPGTIQTVGQLPLVTARLDALGKALGSTIYGISGYRTSAHSVAVGGFAGDPHTLGEAEDIGVNSLLRSSAAQISAAQLAHFGLYRPFDPSGDPSNPEVNHIQLIPAGGPLSLADVTARWSPDPRCQ
jgi:hypothetical protein